MSIVEMLLIAIPYVVPTVTDVDQRHGAAIDMLV